MAEQGDPDEPTGRGEGRFAGLPVALIVGAILVLIAIAAIVGAH
jgi:hypothetical protein